MQYVDETYQDQYFYVTLNDQISNMNQVSKFLQLETTNANKIKYITNTSEIKPNDVLEACFDYDSKWYRAVAKHVQTNSVEIFYVDYGNVELYDNESLLKHKKLRKRLFYENETEASILGLDYQAIKCFYVKDKKLSVESFLDQLWAKNISGSSFDLLVKNFETDAYSVEFFDITTPTTPEPVVNPTSKEQFYEDEDNDEVFNTSASSVLTNMCSVLTMSEADKGLNFAQDTKIDSVISHIVTSSEFYIQSQENLTQLVDQQQRIQLLAKLCSEMQFKSIKGKPTHQIGDVCLAQYLSDSSWYRGVILKYQEYPPQSGEFVYDVFFADYGNIEFNMSENLLCSIQAVKNSIRSSKKTSLELDLKSIIELPFQAICCQIFNKKENQKNTDTLKSFEPEIITFQIKDLKKQSLIEQIEIKKYSVCLYLDNISLQDKFESLTPTIIKNNIIPIIDLEPFSLHEFKLAFCGSETEIYINLNNELNELDKLQAEINANLKQIDKSICDYKFKKNDLVLAKFINEDNTFDWYRAKIIAIQENKYHVFYIDYGNTDTELALNDLRLLPDKFMRQAQFAYNIRLNGITELKDEMQDIILDYLTTDDSQVKIISKQNDCYLVELWKNDSIRCLNKLLDPAYTIVCNKKKGIETSTLDDLYTIKNRDFKVKTKYAYIEDFQRPFYFSLELNVDERQKLLIDLNSFYSSQNNKSKFNKEIEVNDYCAVFSENEWYRAQVKSINGNELHLFHIDYGYEEIIEFNLEKIQPLADQFLNLPRFIFGAYLLKPNTLDRIQFEPKDTEDLQPFLENFFSNSDDDLELIINDKITESIHFKNEFYFGVNILNKNNDNLNHIIVEAKKQLEIKLIKKKPILPDYIRLKLVDIPEQSKTSQAKSNSQYLLFTKRADLFYVFDEELIVNMQEKVQKICEQIMQERDEYEFNLDETRFPMKGDLVFGKYAEDDQWYRCLITNISNARNKYELFFIDFGNTEITSREEILYGWTNEQMAIFKQNQPLAIKCKLYGLKPVEGVQFSDEQTKAFKEITNEKQYNVKFIKFDSDFYEICLKETNKNDWFELHFYLIKNKLGNY